MQFIVPRGLWALCGGLLLAALPARAQTESPPEPRTDWIGPGYWRVALSPFSHHFRYSAEHRYVWAFGVERQRSDDWLAGVSYFRNSFGQPSSYTYVGKRFPGLLDQPELFAQASAGMLYGYRGKFKTKVPLNYNGFSPGALVSLGWQFNKQHAATVHLLGDAGLMIQLSWDLR
ncbi:MAG: ABC transporter ATP-binding protein [Rubrivivax sp.]|nr:ABC transporter ATP-binding protein [Rubrivivax sp.]